jgi:hypothetical protein
LDQADVRATLSDDATQAVFTVHNSLPLCEPRDIGLAAYVKDGPDFVVPQTLVASATDTITSGSKTLTIELPKSGTPPHCFTQVDAFWGPLLHEITATQDYVHRLFDYAFGEVPNCSESVQETTTTTTTAPASIAPQSDVPPLNGETSVEAVQVERAPAVAATELARTGPRTNTAPLVVLAASLLLVGGALLSLANRLVRHSNS